MDIEENNELTYQVCDIYKSSNKRVYYFCRSMVNHTRKNKDYYKKYIDNLLNNSDLDVANIADALLAKYANPEYRFDSISIELAELNTGQQNQILALEMTDIVKIKFTPNNIGSPIEKYARIIGISHSVGNFTHKVSFNLDTLDFSPFVLDDPVFGVLGGAIGTTLYNDSTLTYDDLLTYNGNTTTITGYSLG
jgi:hypothetical protein